MKRTIAALLGLTMTLSLIACAKGEYSLDGGANGNSFTAMPAAPGEDADGAYKSWYEAVLEANPGIEENALVENAWISTLKNNVSTFSSDVDTASYSQFRMLVNSGYTLDNIVSYQGANLRTEEMLNYFTYTSDLPEGENLFGLRAEVSDCPWNREAVLLMMNLRAKTIAEQEKNAGNNLVFLIDVSGSMNSEEKLPLLQSAFRVLVENLTEKDRVSIVTYASGEKVVLEGCPGNRKQEILDAIDKLRASGSTNGSAGMEMAYRVAGDYFIEGGNNRILLATDGDFNVGISTTDGICDYVSGMRSTGIYISTLGFGWVYNDSMMETIADNGNGAYYFIDSSAEAEKVFADDLLSTLYTVAEDVKFQLTFDPAAVEQYRLIGYENRLLKPEDFTDDKKDAGELGAGQTITVCYELKLTETAKESDSAWMTLAVRYKDPGSSVSVPNEHTIGASAYTGSPSDDFRFACGVIGTALLLHESKYAEGLTIRNIETLLNSLDLSGDSYKSEFAELVGKLADSVE